MIFLRSLPILLFLALFAAGAQARAEDAKTKPETAAAGFTYAPAHCDFSASFPEEPFKRVQCKDESEKECFEQLIYTQVFALDSSVNFRVICNPADEGAYDKYSAAVMETTLKAMTRDNYVKIIDSSFREDKGYKQAGLVAEGERGVSSKIYIAQLWIGQKSVMSVEAELVGAPNDEADALFSHLLEGVRPADKNQKDNAPATEEKPATAPKAANVNP